MDIGLAMETAAIIEYLGLVTFLMFVTLFLLVVFGTRKSQDYRKHIADMYVAAKIRFFAKEDNLDLSVEEKTFRSWLKKRSLETKDLDSTISEELKERIANSSDEKIFKK